MFYGPIWRRESLKCSEAAVEKGGEGIEGGEVELAERLVTMSKAGEPSP